ncbi:hypothetical protein Shpa_49 [Paracoccus phage Shpa]|uniref:Uncharacterized protein n=1 Tax=Paracoccus phage Shpa TaxID=1647282 RepID=A0A0U2C158_9CAUD|nr:hypothetical protein FDG85_gp49 [Paracoccus phage Shpa]AKG94560.1 hypothetical protein Shpa_49 [Paracoccus phage Shpa]
MSHEATACRRLWAAAVAAWLDDWNYRYHAAIRGGGDGANILREARDYCVSKFGRSRIEMSGVDVTPEKATAIVALPRDAFRARFKIKGAEDELIAPDLALMRAPRERSDLPPLVAPDHLKGRMTKHTPEAVRAERAAWAAAAGRQGYGSLSVSRALGMTEKNALPIMRRGGWNGERNA